MNKISFPAYDSWWRERYPRAELENIFIRITPYYRMAQFQQVPTLGDLNYFDVAMMPRYTEVVPPGIIRSVYETLKDFADSRAIKTPELRVQNDLVVS